MEISEALVSIVIPTYNGSRYLAKTIESCLEQTYTNWEMIIVDDASEDETPAIIERFVSKDSRIKSVLHDVDRKLPAALNSGFAQSKGQILTWISDDNCFRERALEVMVRCLRLNPDLDVVYCDSTYIDEAGNAIGFQAHCGPDLLPYRNCCGSCFLYRRAVHEALDGFDEDLFLVEDYDFWLRASRSFKLYYLPEDLQFVRVHAGSLSETQNVNVKLATRRILEGCLAEMNWTALQRSLAYLRLTRDAAVLGERWLSLSFLFRALFANPPSLFRIEFSAALVLLLTGVRGFETLKRTFKIGATLDR